MYQIYSQPWRYGLTQLAYTNVSPEYLEFKPNIRVLPARYHLEKQVHYYLVGRYEPGEHELLPKGGFHIRNEQGANYWFDLDKVIVHPSIIQMQKKRDKIARRAAEIAGAPIKNPNERRGRPRLSDEEKALRPSKVYVPTGGKRGRPAKGEVREPKPAYTPNGGKRGRPPLSDEEKALRITKPKTSGGKRGRPSDPIKKAEREQQLKARLEANPLRKRGRPPKY